MPSMDDVARWSLEEKLARLARTADDLTAAIAGQPASVMGRRPDAKNWAPTEVICHLRDTEEGFMGRFQAIAAMDDPTLLGPDPDRWAEERQYLRNDPALAVAAFRRRREDSLQHLKGLAPAGWQRGGVHATRGRLTVGDFVTLMAWHDLNHLDQLQRGLRGQP